MNAADLRDQAAELIRRTTTAQGIPSRATAPGLLARLAPLFARVRAGAGRRAS